MKTQSFVSVFRVTAVALFASSFASIASAQTAREKLSAALGETNDEIVRTGNTLQSAVKALDALTKQEKGDLQPTFDAFSKAVMDTEASANVTRERVEKMRDNLATFFAEWQTEIGKFADPKVKEKAEKRVASVQKQYQELTSDLAKAGEKFRPLLTDLNSVKTALSKDLTAAGVKSVKSVASKAHSETSALHDDLNKVLKKISETQAKLSSSAEK